MVCMKWIPRIDCTLSLWINYHTFQRNLKLLEMCPWVHIQVVTSQTIYQAASCLLGLLNLALHHVWSMLCMRCNPLNWLHHKSVKLSPHAYKTYISWLEACPCIYIQYIIWGTLWQQHHDLSFGSNLGYTLCVVFGLYEMYPTVFITSQACQILSLLQ